MSDEERRLKRYDTLELLARLGGHKDIDYEIDEIKDGRIVSIKNVKIAKIVLDCPI